jgi:hypothetical protein
VTTHRFSALDHWRSACCSSVGTGGGGGGQANAVAPAARTRPAQPHWQAPRTTRAATLAWRLSTRTCGRA